MTRSSSAAASLHERTRALTLSDIHAAIAAAPQNLIALGTRLHARAGFVGIGVRELIRLGAVERDAGGYRVVEGIVFADAVVSSTKKADGEVAPPKRGREPLKLAKLDGTETRVALKDVNEREAKLSRAAGTLASHFIRACIAEGGGPTRMAHMLLDQADAFERAAGELRKAAIVALKPPKVARPSPKNAARSSTLPQGGDVSP